MLLRPGRALALAAALLRPPAADAATVVVGPSDGTCPGSVASRIQSALDAAVPGSTVLVCPGTYDEQLLVTKPVTLRGLPGVRLRPGGLAATATSLRSGRPVAAAVTVRSRATLEGFDVDLSGNSVVPCDGTEPLLAGIFVRGAGVTVRGNAVRGARIEDAPDGCANGVGILAQAAGGSLRIDGNTVSGYQRAGVAIDAPGTRALVRQNLVLGDGDTPDRAQVGIEIGTGTLARVQENVVRGHSGASGAGCDLDAGISLAGARARLRGNQLVANAIGIRSAARGHRLVDDAIDGGATGLVGLWIEGDETRASALTVRGHAVAGVRVDGDRNVLRAATVAAVHDDPRCDALGACAPPLDRCGVGLWLRGRANRATATTMVDVDTPVLDDGRANVVR